MAIYELCRVNNEFGMKGPIGDLKDRARLYAGQIKGKDALVSVFRDRMTVNGSEVGPQHRVVFDPVTPTHQRLLLDLTPQEETAYKRANNGEETQTFLRHFYNKLVYSDL